MPLTPKKSLGQHFLNSKHVLDQIIAAAKIEPGQNILEIGPGTGFLTDALIASQAKVTAIEKDDRAFALLQEKYRNEIEAGKLNLIHGDVLELDPAKMMTGSYSIVANIPYYITGAILQKFLENEPRPDKMVLLVQKEVADRIIAHDGKESILSVSVKAFGQPKMVAKVPRGAFTPPPNVDSAVISIENIDAHNFPSASKEVIARFFLILKSGFAHKRKFLVRNLETALEKEKIEKIWQTLALDAKIRAEDLKISDWFGFLKDQN